MGRNRDFYILSKREARLSNAYTLIIITHRTIGRLDNPLTREILELNEEMNVKEPKESVEELLEANRVI